MYKNVNFIHETNFQESKKRITGIEFVILQAHKSIE